MLKASGVHPVCVLGHSAGEASAAYASGAYTLEEACALVHTRSVLQQKTAGSGRMLVFPGYDRGSITEALGRMGVTVAEEGATTVEPDSVDVACENSPSNTVICAPEPLVLRIQVSPNSNTCNTNCPP